MNGLMVAMGLLFAVLGGYTYRNAKSETVRGLRWSGIDTSKLRVEDHPRAVERNMAIGLLVLVLGGVIALWGVLEWPADLLTPAIFVIWAIGMVSLLFLT